MTLPALIPQQTVDHFGGQQRIDLVRDQIAKGTSDGEFALFLAVCERTGLDPFARQIYAIVRNDKRSETGKKMVIQTGIDGYRSVADRSPAYAGSDRPVFEYDERGRLEAAVVTVWKMNGHERVPFVGVAYWDEYAQDQGLWSKMPRTMLAKCAEAQALRKAFPSQLAGLYTHEEMMQADQESDPWRPYRDELIARARALPEQARGDLKALHPKPFDVRTADPEQLAEFERDLAAFEDETVVDAVIVDDGDTSGTAVPASGADALRAETSAPRSPLDDVTMGGEPVTPQDIAKMANYRLEQRSKKAQRGAVAEELADA